MDRWIEIRGTSGLARLVAAGARLGDHGIGPVAVIGGLAVVCRLHEMHRATSDVDTVVEQQHPDAVEVLRAAPGGEAVPGRSDRVAIDGVVIDVISTTPVDDVAGLDPLQELFVLSHRFALESADVLHVKVTGEREASGAMTVATVAGLVGTKLCGVQGLHGRPDAKRATDAYDLYRLLEQLEDGRAARAAFEEVDGRLRAAVIDAARRQLIDGATKQARAIHVHGTALMDDVSADRISFVAERLVAALGDG